MDLTDEQWRLLEPHLPSVRESGGRGRPPSSQRALLDGILWKLRYNQPWRKVPRCYGSHQACYASYTRWKKSGLLQKLINILIADVQTRGHFDLEKTLEAGVILVKDFNGEPNIYVLAEYTEMWQISTALVRYQQAIRKAQNKLQPGDVY